MQNGTSDFHALLHTAALIDAELRKHLGPLGLQPRQARVLEAMGRMGAVSQTELADAFGITSASMSTMTARLLAAGYITQDINPVSRRHNVLELTDKGRIMLDAVAQAWAHVDATIASLLGNDADTLFVLAQRLRAGLGGGVPGRASADTPAQSSD